jgi:hypothetical protein
MGYLLLEPPDPPWAAAQDTTDDPTALLSSNDDHSNEHLLAFQSTYSTMQANFENLFDMLVQLKTQQDELTAKLNSLLASVQNNHAPNTPPPPPNTTPRYHFVTAAIAHMEKGGPEPWLDHAVPCVPLFLCPNFTSSWPPPDPNPVPTFPLKSMPLQTKPFINSFASVHLAMDMTSRPPPDPDPWSTHRRATTETEHGFLLNACLRNPPDPDPLHPDSPDLTGLSCHAYAPLETAPWISLNARLWHPPDLDPIYSHPIAYNNSHDTEQTEWFNSFAHSIGHELWLYNVSLTSHHNCHFFTSGASFLWPPPAPNLV